MQEVSEMINGESRVHMCISTQIFEGVIHFFQIFPNLTDQIFGRFMPKNFLQQQQQQQFYFFNLNASTFNNTDTVRPGGGEKTLRSSRLPPPKYMLSKTLNECAH